MKKHFFVLMLLLFFSSIALGNPVDVNKAKAIASSFVSQKQTTDTLLHKQNKAPKQIQLQQVTNTENNLLYIFNISDGGFVIISGDDVAQPVLGYSATGTIPNGVMPDNVKSWLNSYNRQIQTAIDSNYTQSEEVARQWSNFSMKINGMVVVGPLLSTAWNQAPQYNKFCPFDSTQNDRTVTGCVATGMAQVINYWEYPNIGFGWHTLHHSRYGDLTANFQNTTYNYALMPDTLKSTSSDAEVDAIATLMYHCGISVDMNYNTSSEGGSSSYASSVVSALKKYWGYSNNVRLIQKDYYYGTFPDSIKMELLAQRPVMLSGSGEGGGHFFVTDGFDSNNYFHINWGWGGLFDGYYTLYALSPGIGGIGGGNGSFNDNVSAIIGVQPAQYPSISDSTNMLQLTSNVTTDKFEIEYLDGFTISTSIKNNGTSDFNGEIAFLVFDLDNTTIFDTIGLQNKSLTAGSEESITFTFPGSSEYTGVHTISLITRPNGGQWQFINSNGYSNRVQIEFTQNKAECGLIYKCDFESELKGWTFAKGSGINSGFVADTATSYNGDKSLYTSFNGGATQGYEASANGYVSVAYKKLYIEAGSYEMDFRYKIQLYEFENIDDYLYIKLIPANQTPQAYNQYVYPDYQNSIWINSYSGSNNYWGNPSPSFTINQDGEYYLTFILACSAGTTGEIGVAIDDISIKKRLKISPITMTENKQGVEFTWQDVDTKYRIRYHGKDNSHYDTAYVNRYFIPYTKLREVTSNDRDFLFEVTTVNCPQYDINWFTITTNPFPQDTCILAPHNVTATNTDRGVFLEWEGNADSYEVTFNNYSLYNNGYRDYFIDTIRTSGTSVTIPYYKLNENFKDFYIRGLCANDTSVWTREELYVEISDTSCIATPKNVYTEHTNNGIYIMWQGNATEYEIECHSEDKYYKRKDLYDYYYVDSNYVRFKSTDNEYTIPYGALPDTLYHIRIRAVCEQDTGFWSEYRSAYNINFGERCVPIFDLCGPKTNCTYGSYSSPYYYNKTIDFGYKDWRRRQCWHSNDGYDGVGINRWDYYRSRHTVCFAGKTDPRCDNLLSTVPPGEDYSIRLGNWYNGEGESVTYTYTIDSGYKLILLLKYAVVLQDPSHSSEQNPHFTLEILDENNRLIDSECLFADFAADKNATGWQTAVNAGHEGELEYQNVVWKDWTTIGVNLSDLSQYGDKTIKIRLTTKDCTLGQHYGYAYFSLSCQDSEIYGMQCATRPLYFEVPEGFNYRWYLMDDTTKTSVCNTRRFDVASNDTCSYHVDLISLENENCFYTMDAYTLPRMPQPVINYTVAPSNCTNYVSFTTDSSFVYKIMLDGSHQRDYRLNIDSIYWDFGEYGKSTNANTTLIVPNEGDTFNVTLRAVTNNCDNITQYEVRVPAIKDTTTYGHRFLCAGDTLHYFGKEYYSEGVYYDTLKTHIGCDSVHILTVDLLVPEYKYYTDTICETELPYSFMGKQYNATGIYEEHIPSSLGCDTIIHQLDLTVITELNITVDSIGEVTANDSPISLNYNITKGTFNGYSITFGQNGINNGFVNKTVTADSTANITIDIPQNATPGKYSATITFYNDLCDDVIIPFEFTLILYSKPNSNADLKLNVHDCTNEIIITNNSNVLKYYTLTDVVVDTETPIDSVRWDFGIYGTSSEFTPSLTVPVAGDTFSVSLTTYAGIYSDTKVYTLEVPSIIPKTEYTYVSICNGDSYTYNGVSYNTEGEHVTSVSPSQYGCDSTHILVITFITAETIETYDSICSNSLPYVFYGQNCTTTGTYTYVVSAQGGCDSLIYTLHLVVYENIDITIADFGEICGDDANFLLSYEINSGYFSTGEIKFGTLATQAGFENVQFSAEEKTFSIPIPDKIRPDEYDGELVFNIFDCMENRFPFKFTILYPSSIIIQRWNDFLGVSSASYNGGYTFSDYQWFLNDAPIESYKPSQIYEEGKELDFNGEYRVLLTRTDDGKAIMTCPFTPVKFNEDDYTAMNTIVYTNEVITATSTSNAKARIYNSIGVVVDSYTINEGETNIKMPAQAGMYTVNIIYDSGKVQNIKIIVRE